MKRRRRKKRKPGELASPEHRSGWTKAEGREERGETSFLARSMDNARSGNSIDFHEEGSHIAPIRHLKRKELAKHSHPVASEFSVFKVSNKIGKP